MTLQNDLDVFRPLPAWEITKEETSPQVMVAYFVTHMHTGSHTHTRTRDSDLRWKRGKTGMHSW
jgi:hypothetical protein